MSEPVDRMKTTKGQPQKCSRATLALLALGLILEAHLTTAQQQSAPQATSQTTQQQQQQQQNKIGLAPHDRPACQLPPMSAGQRRFSAAVNPAEPTSDQSYSSHLMMLANSSQSLSSALTQQLNKQPTSISQKPTGSGGRIAQFDSSDRLRLLRGLLTQNNQDAYLVGSSDEHGSEYVADFDRRLRFISGFTGSAGFALVLLDRAVLFTDGRYALQADQELDCNWWLVVGDNPLQDISLWLKANAAQGTKVTASARLLSMQTFDYLEEQLVRTLGSKFELLPTDLVDAIRDKISAYDPSTQISPATSVNIEPLVVHPLQFSGNVSWQEKVVRLVDSMHKLRGRHYVVSQLDEVAWLLNLRGNDIPQSPLFKAFVVLSVTSRSPVAPSPTSQMADQPQATTASLTSKLKQPLNPVEQLQQTLLQQQPSPMTTTTTPSGSSQFVRLSLFVDLRKIDQQVWDHLRVNNISILQHQRSSDSLQPADQQQQPAPAATTTSLVTTRIQVDLEDYGSFLKEFGDRLTLAGGSKQPIQGGRLLLNAGANVAIHALAKEHEDRLILVESLVQKLKAVKSDADVQGMRQAHWRDSLAISMLLSQLEQDIGLRKQTQTWNEVSAAKELEFYRSLMDYNRGQSFDTISAYGSNAAIVHYRPNYEATSADELRPIGNQSTYLLDCGGQYLDGTTDITRTVHFGEPTEFQRETYTRVLMGSIDMMSLIFDQPKRSPYRINDLLARRHLFELGLDYAHGTGHGIGLYSLVHEAPALIEHYSSFSSSSAASKSAAATPSGGGAGGKTANVESHPILLQPNMFSSVEPGYYKSGDFGIRLENIVVTQRVHLRSSLSRPNDRSADAAGQQRQFLRFEPLSLVPFEPKMIKLELLSNKQKTWLNSYNLMVRLRMTQQINHYLAKIRSLSSTQSSGSGAGAAGEPIAIRGISSSSQLHQQLAESAANDTMKAAEALHQLGQYNYLRLDSSRLQEKLEQTHKWIMSKTELIPLDVPQSLIAETNQQLSSPSLTRKVPPSGGRKPAGHSPSPDPMSGQRLMLAYMSSMPFNDLEAGQAIESLSHQEQMDSLNARTENATTSGSSDGSQPDLAPTATISNKCHGFECDIWLVSALNSHPSSAPARTSIKRAGPDVGWPEMGEASSSSSVFGSGSSKLIGNELAGSLLDLFALKDPNASGGNGLWSLGSLWLIAILSLIVALQLGIMAALMCSGGRSGKLRTSAGSSGSSGSGGRRRNWCPNSPHPQRHSPSVSLRATDSATAAGQLQQQEMRQESTA